MEGVLGLNDLGFLVFRIWSKNLLGFLGDYYHSVDRTLMMTQDHDT